MGGPIAAQSPGGSAPVSRHVVGCPIGAEPFGHSARAHGAWCAGKRGTLSFLAGASGARVIWRLERLAAACYDSVSTAAAHVHWMARDH
jgi:hypothetical protein